LGPQLARRNNSRPKRMLFFMGIGYKFPTLRTKI